MFRTSSFFSFFYYFKICMYMYKLRMVHFTEVGIKRRIRKKIIPTFKKRQQFWNEMNVSILLKNPEPLDYTIIPMSTC